MTLERFRQIRNLYEAALEKDPAERSEFLAQACQGDRELGSEVDRLLIANERAADFIDGPLLASIQPNGDTEKMPRMEGRRVGAYLLLREIGRGGMGTVYLASRADDVVHKQVAIKVVRAGVEADVLRRFRQERDILAALDHPSIARFIDGGSTEEGLPYFVMEYVEGLPIDTWCDRRKLNVTERLKLFRAVCDGVQYAHQRLVVHRDLKPANILVTDDGGVKLLDFGIAKLLDTEDTRKDRTTTLTHAMTPEYASPEQVLGQPIYTTSDIYALGVVLYELLTGHRPYHMRSRVLHEVARVICEEAPTRPSVVITEEVFTKEDGKAAASPQAISEVREGDPARLRHRLEGDLDNILLKSLEKAASRRYSSADQFSEDVRRHLEGLPVSARKDTFWYRIGKFIQRHQIGVAATALIFAALFLGLFTTLWQTGITMGAQIEQVRNGPSGAVPDTRGVFVPGLVQFVFLLWIALGVVAFFTRATPRRVAGALAGGVLFVIAYTITSLPMSFEHLSYNLRHTPVLAYAATVPVGAMIALLGWRATRRFGWRGQLALLLAICLAGPIPDYIVTTWLPGVPAIPGFLPWFEDRVPWFFGVASSLAMMRLVAGPAAKDQITGLLWKL